MIIRSENFVLVPLQISDSQQLHQIFTHPHVRKYLLDDDIVPMDFAEEEIKRSIDSFANNGYGLWGAWDVDQKEMFGFTGYRPFFDPPQLQLLYGLLPEYSGRGLATEMASLMIDYGFQALNFSEIVAATDEPNRASERVMAKAGLQFWKRERHPDQQWVTVYYRLDNPV